MSQYNATVSRQQHCLTVVRQNLPMLHAEQDALLAGLSSASLNSLGAEVLAASSTEELLGVAAQIQALPGLDLLASSLSSEVCAMAASLADTSGTAGGPSLAAAQVDLGNLLSQATDTMASVERLTTAETVAAVLPNLGYQVARSDAPHATAFEATMGQETMLVVVTDGAGVQTDHASLSDVPCQTRQDDFVAAMAEAGAVLTEQEHVEHDDPRGGSLIAAAAREGSANLAEGAAALADRQSAASLTVDRLHQGRAASRTARPSHLEQGGF